MTDDVDQRVLRMVGLFDRPAPMALLNALRVGPTIHRLNNGLTETLFLAAIAQLRTLRPGAKAKAGVSSNAPMLLN